ncbi:MAG: RusA family crossover junction endodeoxyribonuclease [Firmicutes bacterium]|nr:RusA family crossover junction endodeoxyribonuclease [Bacillota bacterium]
MNNIQITIPFTPVSKKNHQQIIRIGGVPRIIQSKQYREYEKAAVLHLHMVYKAFGLTPIEGPVNVQMVFYMPTRRRVDLVNLQEAALDVLVRGEVLADDNSKIVVSMDGSRVSYDKEHPRTEITISEGGEV